MSTRDKQDELLKRAAAELLPVGSCPGDAHWVAFYQGTLEESDAEAIREHLATCSACVTIARDASRFVAAMSEMPPRIRAPRARRFPRWAVAAAVAACAVLAVFLLVPDRTPQQSGGLVWRGDDGTDAFAVAVEPYRAGHYREAEVALESYVLAHPADDEARLYLAVCRIHVGRKADARRELTRLAEEAEGRVREEARRRLAELDRDSEP